MNTPSHFLITAALRKALRKKIVIPKSAVWLGSTAPDIPLYLLSLAGYLYFHHHLGWPVRQTMRYIYETLFYHDPGWIAIHNVLHSPTSLLVGLALTSLFPERWRRLKHWIHWFLGACLLHAGIDIATHFDDGPLLFWPLSSTIRFSSPISYWDKAHYGHEFAQFECVLDLWLAAYLFLPWKRLRGRL